MRGTENREEWMKYEEMRGGENANHEEWRGKKEYRNRFLFYFMHAPMISKQIIVILSSFFLPLASLVIINSCDVLFFVSFLPSRHSLLLVITGEWSEVTSSSWLMMIFNAKDELWGSHRRKRRERRKVNYIPRRVDWHKLSWDEWTEKMCGGRGKEEIDFWLPPDNLIPPLSRIQNDFFESGGF